MDFRDSIRQLAQRAETLMEQLATEEATKTALIMPFLQALGYDVFNPTEIVPEFTCDVGTKKNEKIDYAIFRDGQPTILIECKHWKGNLNIHDNQLLRYFNVSKARFGILTNGLVYRFYSDIDEPNKMDGKPFLEINILDLKDAQIEEIKKFHKSYYNENDILSSASELKYMWQLKSLLAKEFVSPSEELVKCLGKQIYTSVFTKKVIEQFTPIVKRTIASYINDQIAERLKTAVKQEEERENENIEAITSIKSDIITTEEELQGYYIVKAILRDVVSVDRIQYKDNKEYFVVNLDNTRKPICRLYLNVPTNKQLRLINEDKSEEKIQITSIDDIYLYAKQLTTIARRYLE